MTDWQTVLIRHGETEWSREGRHTGWTDIPLSPTGRVQAEALAAPLANWSFSTVLCSPLERARETCALAGYSAAAVPVDSLREWGYGTYEGRTTTEIQAERPGWVIWKDGVVGGETVDDVGRRADAAIAARREIDGDVAIFAHGHLLHILGARWIGLEPIWGRALSLSTASISVLGFEHGIPVIARWNDTSHLRER